MAWEQAALNDADTVAPTTEITTTVSPKRTTELEIIPGPVEDDDGDEDFEDGDDDDDYQLSENSSWAINMQKNLDMDCVFLGLRVYTNKASVAVVGGQLGGRWRRLGVGLECDRSNKSSHGSLSKKKQAFGLFRLREEHISLPKNDHFGAINQTHRCT